MALGSLFFCVLILGDPLYDSSGFKLDLKTPRSFMVIHLGFLSFQKAAVKTWQGHVVIEWISQCLLRSQVDSSLLAPGGDPGYVSHCHPTASMPSLCIPVASVRAHDSPIKWQKHDQKCDQTASTFSFCRNADSIGHRHHVPNQQAKEPREFVGRFPIVMVPHTLTLLISYIYQK